MLGPFGKFISAPRAANSILGRLGRCCHESLFVCGLKVTLGTTAVCNHKRPRTCIVRTYVYVYIYIYTYTYMYLCVHTYMHTYTYIDTYSDIQMYIGIEVYMHTYIYKYIYRYIYICTPVQNK